ncbi:MAG: hypothetical protein WC965_01855 [Thiohalomonadaceae bacterium]
MLATKIGKFLYRNKVTEKRTHRDAELWVVSSILGGAQFGGQTIGECIFALPLEANDPDIMRHEYIHVKQWRRLGSIGFPVRYFWEFISNYLKLVFSGYKGDKRMEAYRNISLEKEAG